MITPTPHPAAHASSLPPPQVPCLVSPLGEKVDGSTFDVAKQLLTCTGVGATGELRAEPSVLDFGSVLVGESERRTLSLINPTAVALYYSLTFEQNDGPPPAILAGGDGEMHPLLTMEEGMTTGVVQDAS